MSHERGEWLIVMHATLPIDADEREAALELVTDLAERSRAENGVVDYRVTTDVEDETVVRVDEQYEDAGHVAYPLRASSLSRTQP